MNPYTYLNPKPAGAFPLMKFGSNAAANATQQTMWSAGGNYPWSSWGDWDDATGKSFHIVSTDSEDDATSSPVGTGAQQVDIQGLGPLGVLQSETVTLEGTSNVALTKAFTRIFRMKVVAGSDQAGTIKVIDTAPSPDVIVAEIDLISGETNNQSTMCIYTVPAGYNLYLHEVSIAQEIVRNKTVNCYLLARSPSDTVFRRQFTVSSVDGYHVAPENPLCYGEGTDLDLKAKWEAGEDGATNGIMNATLIPKDNATAAQIAEAI